jgi:hypothetical protein
MGIGVSIFLIAVGLILALAVDVNVSGIDINVIGWILVLVGIVGLAMTALIFAPRRRAVREQTWSATRRCATGRSCRSGRRATSTELARPSRGWLLRRSVVAVVVRVVLSTLAEWPDPDSGCAGAAGTG